MKRAIVSAATLAPAALAELKDWLGITTAAEDSSLNGLIRAALETCEAFTGTLPLVADCEELLPARSDWQRLQTSPVFAITEISSISDTNGRLALPSDAYALDFAVDGAGRVRVFNPGLVSRIAVRFTAGLAPDWSSLPDGLRHGVIRLAAHHYRQRENGDKSMLPPAAVAAAWRPWRQIRLL
ncbi:MAG: phage head-tail connector protein [Pseudomonadota bacterium]